MADEKNLQNQSIRKGQIWGLKKSTVSLADQINSHLSIKNKSIHLNQNRYPIYEVRFFSSWQMRLRGFSFKSKLTNLCPIMSNNINFNEN